MKPNINASAIDELSVADLAAMGASTFALLDEDLSQQAQSLASRKAKFEAALQRRYEPTNNPGTEHRQDEGYDITITVPKTVEWDQEKLIAILDAMPPEEARHYAKAKFTVDERKFAAAPPVVQKTFSDARAIKPGKPRWAFKALEKEPA